MNKINNIYKTHLYYYLEGQLGIVDMTRTVQNLSAEGYPVNRRILATMSPYVTRNLRRYGDYVVDLSSVPQPFEGAINLPIDIFET